MSEESAVKYFIQAPLAKASEDTRDTYPIIQLPIAAGPVAIKNEETGEVEVIRRRANNIKLIRGEGYTTNPLEVAYLREQWGDALTITEIDPNAEVLSEDLKYVREVEQLSQRNALLASARPSRKELASQREKLEEEKEKFLAATAGNSK